MTQQYQYDVPPRRGFGYWLRGILTAFLTMTIVLAVAAGAVFYYLMTRFEAAGPLTQTKTVTVRHGMGLTSIARWLERKGAISDYRIFIAGALYHKANGRLKAGEYNVKQRSSMSAIMRQLIDGRSITHKFTVPEGFTSEQVVARMNADKTLLGDIAGLPGEGALLPETYVYHRGKTRAQLIAEMKAAQKKLLDDLWPKRAKDLPIKSRAQALVLASIVEKETGVKAERARVAAVFMNRLRKSMKLQSDPTIIYGLVGGKGSLGRPLRQSELDKKTPYNTYRIAGLPPTPIANPGRAAIIAVLNPATTKELFFVADGTGGHAFAETLTEHQKNVVKWRAIEKQRARKITPAASKPKVRVKPAAKSK